MILQQIEEGRCGGGLETFEAAAEAASVLEGIHGAAESKSITLRLEAQQRYSSGRFAAFPRSVAESSEHALKFRPAGGSIAVSIFPDTEQGICRFAVEDTGVGIAPEQLAGIFDKFYQVGSTTKGVREGWVSGGRLPNTSSNCTGVAVGWTVSRAREAVSALRCRSIYPAAAFDARSGNFPFTTPPPLA